MQTRRDFVQQCVAGVAAAAPLANFAAADNPTTPREKLQIIDCHTHFYDPSRPQGVPWPGKGSQLYRTVLPKHLRAMPKPRPLAGTVIVEASSWIEDNQWLLDLAKDDPFVVGVVGRLDPNDDDFDKHLQRFSSNKLFRGIRVSQQQISDSTNRRRMRSFQALLKRDLQLDVNGGPDMPQLVAAFAKQLPELRIVINHVGNVAIDGKEPPTNWTRGMQAASQNDNVYCKVSALVEGASRGGKKAPDDVDYYRPVLDATWEAFGDDRLIFGSNWPVSESAADYATLQQLVLDYISARGAEAEQKFFALNSQRAYKWIDRGERS